MAGKSATSTKRGALGAAALALLSLGGAAPRAHAAGKVPSPAQPTPTTQPAAPAPASAPAPAPTGTLPASPPRDDAGAAASDGSVTPLPLAPPDAAMSEKPPEPAPPPPPPPRKVAIGAHLGALGAAAPWDLPSAGLFLDSSRLDNTRFLSWSYRLTIEGTTQGTVRSDVGSAAFQWLYLEADACPTFFTIAPERWYFWPCVRIDAGVVRAASQDNPSPRSATRPWLTAGFLGRIQWRIDDVFFLEAQAGMVRTILSDSFAFDGTDPPLYKASTWLPTSSAGVGIAF